MAKKRKYTESVCVMLKSDTLLQLNEITDAREISNSEFIRKIIEDAIIGNKEEKNEK